MNKISLFEELRLIERCESEISGAWKGIHLLLFFLAFVFGSFCTFCFHMLMYLFDEKCVLFPKLLSLTSLRHNVIYEFIPEEKERADSLPVDFLSTQWVEKSACYLPTYVPLVSGIFGLVWTSMFLMCSTGSRTLTGLQRPWRVIPPVFVFSLAMGCLCIYSSAVTHYGLRDLCFKLGEISGSSTCSYTVNVATLAYERKIRGVYQATRLTIASAWLHTGCWLASAILALVRILLAIDFRLVKVRVELVGDIDKMLERNEKQLQSVFPNPWIEGEGSPRIDKYSIGRTYSQNENNGRLSITTSDILFISKSQDFVSELSLVPEERKRMTRLEAYEMVREEHQFIVKLLYDLLDNITNNLIELANLDSSTSSSSIENILSPPIMRQFGKEAISSIGDSDEGRLEVIKIEENKIYDKIHSDLVQNLDNLPTEEPQSSIDRNASSSSKKRGHIVFDSAMNIAPEMHPIIKAETKPDTNLKLKKKDSKLDISAASSTTSMRKKSNLKKGTRSVAVQTDNKNKRAKTKQKVTIADSKSTYDEETSSNDSNKKGDTQTDRKKKRD